MLCWCCNGTEDKVSLTSPFQIMFLIGYLQVSGMWSGVTLRSDNEKASCV
jgi:hypothetical protein